MPPPWSWNHGKIAAPPGPDPETRVSRGVIIGDTPPAHEPSSCWPAAPVAGEPPARANAGLQPNPTQARPNAATSSRDCARVADVSRHGPLGADHR